MFDEFAKTKLDNTDVQRCHERAPETSQKVTVEAVVNPFMLSACQSLGFSPSEYFDGNMYASKEDIIEPIRPSWT